MAQADTTRHRGFSSHKIKDHKIKYAAVQFGTCNAGVLGRALGRDFNPDGPLRSVALNQEEQQLLTLTKLDGRPASQEQEDAHSRLLAQAAEERERRGLLAMAGGDSIHEMEGSHMYAQELQGSEAAQESGGAQVHELEGAPTGEGGNRHTIHRLHNLLGTSWLGDSSSSDSESKKLPIMGAKKHEHGQALRSPGAGEQSFLRDTSSE